MIEEAVNVVVNRPFLYQIVAKTGDGDGTTLLFYGRLSSGTNY